MIEIRPQPLALRWQSDDLPARIEASFDRQALVPRLGVLFVLFAGALADYGHGHRVGHWVVLAAYGAATLAVAAGTRVRARAVARWLPAAATCVDAAIAVYVIADHLPLGASVSRHGTEAVARLPAFLFLLQTGLRLRPSLVLTFSGLVATGWLASAVLVSGSMVAGEHAASFLWREGTALAAFLAAAAFVLYAAVWMRGAAASTLRAWEERLILARFLPSGVASEVIRQGGTASVAAQHATLLSVDIRGSSVLASRMPPAELVSLLLSFRARVHDAVTGYGGIVDKYVGDGVIALFLSGDRADQASRAVATVEGVFRAIAELNSEDGRTDDQPIRVIAALHAGEVLAGVFDDGRRAEFTVLGPSMNDLSRIERRAKEADCDAIASGEVISVVPPARLAALKPRLLAPPTQANSLPELYALLVPASSTTMVRSTEAEPSLLSRPDRQTLAVAGRRAPGEAHS
ncbi:adenylate/guanylate cyclase domain-containing protein [Enterovirga aerilata]|uniref:Adenylate/guanylate cyclase domain-containing protein n=1 Tax=Enterovirga aerilata TaxID=2730920 RepID=A0A849I928_9HYPH|nr:adenylate/guanylate cyclase domain-containing protein [Enterovirga sp. DB1703]NNM73898.1 adenylate/guanylate cyclase domain-containing protein [Enterovirga sp. DB1703]